MAFANTCRNSRKVHKNVSVIARKRFTVVIQGFEYSFIKYSYQLARNIIWYY